MENRSIVRKTVVLIRAQLTAWVVTALLLLLMALFLFKLELNESKVSLGMNAVYVLSCFFGGLAAGKGGKKRKFLWGLPTGTIYFLVSVVLEDGDRTGEHPVLFAGGGSLPGWRDARRNDLLKKRERVERAGTLPEKYRWIFKKKCDILKMFL